METLPYEVLHRIFWLLPFEDKLTCLTVSKYWYRSAKQPAFYSDITLRQSNTLEDAMTYFETNRDLASVVKNVNITQCSNILRHLVKFQDLLPNVKKLILNDDPEDNYHLDPSGVELPSGGTLECLEELTTKELLNQPSKIQIILSNGCPNLVVISTVSAEPSEKAHTAEHLHDLFRNIV